MIDGGGAGQTGDRFEGGGLFSLIANMVADPYGSKDPERRKERMKVLGLLDTGMDMSAPPAAPTVAPVVRTGPTPSYANMDMGEAGRGANLEYPQLPDINRNYRIKGTNDPVGVTTEGDAYTALLRRMQEGAHNPAYTSEKRLIDRSMFNPRYEGTSEDDMRRYLMPPTAGIMDQVRGAANRQPAGTPTSMYEPSPEDMMRQKMRNAGYDPTGLGVHEMQLFIDAMGL